MVKPIFLGAVTLLLIGTLFSCGQSDSTSVKTETYERGKRTLKEIETASPVRFLKVRATDKRNLLGQTVVKGTIESIATVVTYKDVEVELSFYSKTGVLLEKDREKIYETIAPGADKDFKTKYFAPKGTDSVALSIVSAHFVAE